MSDLPPLPTTDWQRYTADQMREYALAAVAAEREACAKVCDVQSSEWHGHDGKYALEDAANRIRAR